MPNCKKKLATDWKCDKAVSSSAAVTVMGKLVAGNEFWLNFYQIEFEGLARYLHGLSIKLQDQD